MGSPRAGSRPPRTATIRPLQVVRWPGAVPWRDGTSVCRPLVSPPPRLACTAKESRKIHVGEPPSTLALTSKQRGCKTSACGCPRPQASGKPTQAARVRRRKKPSPFACKEWGLTQRVGGLSYPTRGQSSPMGLRASRAHGSWGGWRRSQGARRPVRPSAFAGVGPPLCRCWTRSGGWQRLATVRAAGWPMGRQCGAKRVGVPGSPVFGVQPIGRSDADEGSKSNRAQAHRAK